METLSPAAPQSVAVQLKHRFPHARFVFRNEASLALCFSLGEVVPVVDDAELADLLTRADRRDRVICLDVTDDHRPLPRGFEKVLEMQNGSKRIVVAASVLE